MIHSAATAATTTTTEGGTLHNVNSFHAQTEATNSLTAWADDWQIDYLNNWLTKRTIHAHTCVCMCVCARIAAESQWSRVSVHIFRLSKSSTRATCRCRCRCHCLLPLTQATSAATISAVTTATTIANNKEQTTRATTTASAISKKKQSPLVDAARLQTGWSWSNVMLPRYLSVYVLYECVFSDVCVCVCVRQWTVHPLDTTLKFQAHTHNKQLAVRRRRSTRGSRGLQRVVKQCASGAGYSIQKE